MPKVKANALKKTRLFFQKPSPELDISSDSDSSEKSEEYSHVPIENLNLTLENLRMELHPQPQPQPQPQPDFNPLEGINQQLARMMQTIEAISARQAQYDIQLRNVDINRASSSRSNDTNSRGAVAQGDPFRIPDPIKILPSFNGNKKQLTSWLETAGKTLGLFENLVSAEIYQIYLTAVSNKIEGHAKDVLCTNGNPTTFEEIKEILTAALGDKQELSTYNCQLWHNKMDGSIGKHYQRTKQLVYNIKSLAKQNPKYNEHWDAINDFIDEYSLAAYVSGLQKPYFGYVQAAEPKNIENAYAFICKFTSNESNRTLTQTQSAQQAKKVEYNNSRPQYKQKPDLKQRKSETTDIQAEPMDIGSTKSKLTLTKRVNNHEIVTSGTDDENDDENDEEIDVNFLINPPTDPDE